VRDWLIPRQNLGSGSLGLCRSPWRTDWAQTLGAKQLRKNQAEQDNEMLYIAKNGEKNFVFYRKLFCSLQFGSAGRVR